MEKVPRPREPEKHKYNTSYIRKTFKKDYRKCQKLFFGHNSGPKASQKVVGVQRGSSGCPPPKSEGPGAPKRPENQSESGGFRTYIYIYIFILDSHMAPYGAM